MTLRVTEPALRVIVELVRDMEDAGRQAVSWLRPGGVCCLARREHGYCTNPHCAEWREYCAVKWAREAFHAANQLAALLAAPAEHDKECESELTSHGYTPCRCHERAGICYCRKNPCECLDLPPAAEPREGWQFIQDAHKECVTTLVPSEWEAALRWRERFLDEGRDGPAALDPQIVAYLIQDAENLRSVDRVLRDAAQHAPPAPPEDRS